MTSKKENKQLVKRRVRRKENKDLDETTAKNDRGLGHAARRGWGAGAAK